MKKIILPFLLFFALFSCNSNAENKRVNSIEFNKLIESKKDVVLIDIRTPEEYQNGHLKDAVNIDWYNNFEDYIQELDTNKTILFYCKSGGRSAEAAKLFAYKGFKNAYELQGGILAWENASLPVVTPKGPANEGISVEQYRELIQSKALVLVDFNAPWCKPCKQLSPILDAIAEEKKDIVLVQKIDVDQNKPLAKSMEVLSLPLIILYKNGKEVWRINQLTTKEKLTAVIESYQQ